MFKENKYWQVDFGRGGGRFGGVGQHQLALGAADGAREVLRQRPQRRPVRRRLRHVERKCLGPHVAPRRSETLWPLILEPAHLLQLFPLRTVHLKCNSLRPS